MVCDEFNIDIVVDRATVISGLTEKFSLVNGANHEQFFIPNLSTNFGSFNASSALMRTHATMFPAIDQGPNFL